MQSVTVPFVTGLAGVMLGAALVSRTEDTVTVKTLRIVDEDGVERILADASGIVLSGAEKGDAVQIKAGDRPQVSFRRDGTTFLSVGELKDAKDGVGKLDGMVAYNNGALRFGLSASTNGSHFLLDSVETSKTIEDFIDRKNQDSTFVSLSAVDNVPQISIGDASGKTRSFVLEGSDD